MNKKSEKILVDCHLDIAYSIRANRRNFEDINPKFMISYDQLRKSGADIFFSTIFVSHRRASAYKEEAIQQIKFYKKILKDYDSFYQILTNNNLKNTKSGKIGLYFLMEGAEPISDIDDLKYFTQMGIRTIGLTWNNENQYAFGVNQEGELKKKGYDLINNMNDLGVSLDLSHLSEKSFNEAINETSLIPIASHSNCYKLRRHNRNLKDYQLKKISNLGGVTGIVLYNRFLTSKEKADLNDVFKHFKHMLNVCGEDHIALGSDFDGAPIEDFPKGISEISDIEKIINLLMKNRIKPSIIDKFLGQNILRVLNENLKDK